MRQDSTDTYTVKSEHDEDTFDPMKIADNLNKKEPVGYLELTLDEKVNELIKRIALKTMG